MTRGVRYDFHTFFAMSLYKMKTSFPRQAVLAAAVWISMLITYDSFCSHLNFRKRSISPAARRMQWSRPYHVRRNIVLRRLRNALRVYMLRTDGSSHLENANLVDVLPNDR